MHQNSQPPTSGSTSSAQVQRLCSTGGVERNIREYQCSFLWVVGRSSSVPRDNDTVPLLAHTQTTEHQDHGPSLCDVKDIEVCGDETRSRQLCAMNYPPHRSSKISSIPRLKTDTCGARHSTSAGNVRECEEGRRPTVILNSDEKNNTAQCAASTLEATLTLECRLVRLLARADGFTRRGSS